MHHQDQELQNISCHFHAVEIDQKLFLISKNSGEVQLINTVARLFIELAELGCDNEQIIEDVHQVLSADKNQIAQDLEIFCSALKRLLAQECHEHEEQESNEDNSLIPLESYEPITLSYLPSEEVSHNSNSCISHIYKINQIYFNLTYPSESIAQVCHSILSPMSVDIGGLKEETFTEHIIAIELGKEGFLIRIDNEPVYYTSNQDLIPNYLRTSLINLAGAEIENWLSLHAAAVSDNTGQSILFAASSGSGKSTLSLELFSQGANYLGDDMLMINLDKKRLVPFTTAVNLKPGSWPIFSERYTDLHKIPTLQEKTRPVKYFPVEPKENGTTFNVKALIFPTYKKNIESTLTPLDIDQVIHCLAESGSYSQVKGSVSMSKKYLEFFLGLKAYKLDYQTSEDAIRLLKEAKILTI